MRSELLTSSPGADGRVAPGELRVRADASELPRVRDYADAAAAAFGLEGHDRYQFMFAVNEAATNAMRHGTPYEDGTIRLCFSADDDTLSFAVHDRGPFSRPDSRTPEEGGRGLAMIAALMDEFQVCIESDGTVMRLSKRRTALGSASD